MIHQLRFRLLVMMISVVLVAMGTMALLTWYSTRTAFFQFVDLNEDTQRARVEESVFRFIQDAETLDDVQPFLNEMSLVAGVEIVVLDDDGEQVLRSEEHEFEWYDDDDEDDEDENYTLPLSATPIMIRVDGVPAGDFVASPNTYVSFTTSNQTFTGSINRSLLVATGLASAAAIVIALALSQAISQPVTALTNAAQELEAGNLNPEITVQGRGEIGQLAEAFGNMAATLEKNEQLRRNMVSDVAHELRTPITNLRGYVEGVQDGLIPLEPALLDSLYEEILIVNHLIDDLQQLSLAEAGKLRLHIAPVDLNEVVQQVVFAWVPRANERSIQLKTDIQDCTVNGDRKRIYQILQNLVSNAVKYTPDGGTVQIQAARTGNDVTVKVIDNGKGIPPEDLPYVFERFYRVDGSRSRTTGGTGLGLAITQQLVQAHGGSIYATSVPDHETAFVLTLPLVV